MLHRIALRVAKTSIQEIRLLLRQGKYSQALVIAESVKNLPVDESNLAQELDIKANIAKYLSLYSDRRQLSHWRDFVSSTGIAEVALRGGSSYKKRRPKS